MIAGALRDHNVTVKKLDRDHYLDLQTGETKEYKHTENRAQSEHFVRQSLRYGRDVINTNVTADNVEKTRWVTLTYAENMTDPKRLLKDFEEFNRRLRKKYGKYEYITAAEPQGRGAWHLHAILIFPEHAPFLLPEEVSEAWRQGFVKIKKIDTCDNVGAYLSAYLGDLAVDEDCQGSELKEVTAQIGSSEQKRVVKGARLSLYPPGMHIFRWSRGIKKPTRSVLPYAKAKEKAGGGTPTYSSAFQLEGEGFSTTLVKEHYNTERAKSQDD